MLTPKQQTVLYQAFTNHDWRLMINYGAVRAGKTIVDNIIFLYEVRRVAQQAQAKGIDNPLYILAGVSSKTIWNNVLIPLMNMFEINPAFDTHKNFKLFGVTIVQAYTGSVGGLGGIRGLTAWGAYINEASMANEEVFTEIRNRCSESGARVVCDTNPDVPTHWLKKKYIDNPDKHIISNHFVLDDNTFLDPEYIAGLKATTPSGMFYDRAILGLWVADEGIVYKDFDKDKMVIKQPLYPLTYYTAGIDWGYEHPTSIVVFGHDDYGNHYLIEEHTAKYKEIDYWIEVANEIRKRYGQGMRFWADTARSEHIESFKQHGINCLYGYKNVLDGIERVAKSMKTNHFYVLQQASEHFLEEVYTYVWDDKKGTPVKEHDHICDAVRYCLATPEYLAEQQAAYNHTNHAQIRQGLKNMGL